MSRVARSAQEGGTHHRGRGEGDHQRHAHRDRQGDGEFPEQPPKDAAHQEDRNEHRQEGNRNREDREADFCSPTQRRLARRQALLQMPHDVFDDDDGVIHDKPGGDGQRHERQVVDAIAEEIHGAEGADERHGHHHTRDNGGAHRAEKDEHHQDDEQDREAQRELHIMHRGADGRGTIEDHHQGHGRRDLGLQVRQDGAHAVDRRDDIGARLPPDGEQDRGFAIDQTAIADVFRGVDHVGDISQAHGRSLPVGDDDRLVVFRLQQLVRGIERPGTAVVSDLPFRTVSVGAAEHGTYILETQPVTMQDGGIDAHPHGW